MINHFGLTDIMILRAAELLFSTCRGHLMGMSALVYHTAETVRRLPDDGNRYETVYGELLVTPSPRPWHQFVIDRIARSLIGYVEAEKTGFIVRAPADISWGPDILVQPDLFVVDPAEARTLDWKEMKTLKLVVEVLSPGTQRHDRFTKRKLYQNVGVPTYWIADADEHFIEVWTPQLTFPTVERTEVIWEPEGASTALTMDLAHLFRPL